MKQSVLTNPVLQALMLSACQQGGAIRIA